MEFWKNTEPFGHEYQFYYSDNIYLPDQFNEQAELPLHFTLLTGYNFQ